MDIENEVNVAKSRWGNKAWWMLALPAFSLLIIALYLIVFIKLEFVGFTTIGIAIWVYLVGEALESIRKRKQGMYTAEEKFGDLLKRNRQLKGKKK